MTHAVPMKGSSFFLTLCPPAEQQHSFDLQFSLSSDDIRDINEARKELRLRLTAEGLRRQQDEKLWRLISQILLKKRAQAFVCDDWEDQFLADKYQIRIKPVNLNEMPRNPIADYFLSPLNVSLPLMNAYTSRV